MHISPFSLPWRSAALILGLTALSGCGGIHSTKPDPQFSAVTIEDVPTPAPSQNGAIYQASHGYSPLTNGAKAAMVGDIVTISLVEQLDANNANSTNNARTSNFSLTPPGTGPLSLFNNSDTNISGDTSFSGSGDSNQSSGIRGEISVTIAKVFPNGTMEVRGEKLLTLQQGNVRVRVRGLIRSSDISPNNRISSGRVADAQIVYVGDGTVARATKQGWLHKFFNAVSPF